MKVGDLVTIKPHVQPPALYGIGLIIEIQEAVPTYGGLRTKARVKWSKLPDKKPMFVGTQSLEVVNESR